MADTALRIRDLHKRFDETRALDGVSLELERGSLTGLVGSDGAGKTTLIRIVAGLLAPDSGNVEMPAAGALHGAGSREPVGAAPRRAGSPGPWHRAARRRAGRALYPGAAESPRSEAPAVGYLSQGFSLYSDLSIDENMRFFASLYGLKSYRDRAKKLLTLVGLEPFRSRRAGKLSGGMKKKLALACALIHEPELLLLDEPTTGVDPVSRREFWSILSRLQHEGISVLLATPYFDEAERCDHVVLMHAGRAVDSGPPEHVAASTPGSILEVVCSPVRKAQQALAGDPRVAEVQLYGDRIHVRTEDSAEDSSATSDKALRSMLKSLLESKGVSVTSVREIRAGLETAFIARMTAHTEKEAS